MAVRPTSTVCSGTEPTAAGARFGTVTTKLCAAVMPPGSTAVTVTVATPFARAATVTMDPATDADATPVSETDTSYTTDWPSGSSKCGATSTVADCPADSSREAISPTASGGRLGTVTAKS